MTIVTRLSLLCLLFICGCQPLTLCKTHEEYVETTKWEWDPERGVVEYPQASWTLQWER